MLQGLLSGSTVQPPRRDPSLIDQTRLESYCPRSETFLVRMDASHNPSFWAELHISLPQLRDWLRQQGVELEWSHVDSC